MLNTSPRIRTYENLPGVVRLDIPAVAPLPSGETPDTTRIVERFGASGDDAAILATGLHNGNQVVYVKPDKLVEFAEFVRSDPQLHYEALTDVTAIDRSELPVGRAGVGDSLGTERFQTVYQLRS